MRRFPISDGLLCYHVYLLISTIMVGKTKKKRWIMLLENILASNSIWTKHVTYTYICLGIHVIIIKSHAFEREQRSVCGRFKRMKRKEKCSNNIPISKNKVESNCGMISDVSLRTPHTNIHRHHRHVCLCTHNT